MKVWSFYEIFCMILMDMVGDIKGMSAVDEKGLRATIGFG